MDQTPTRTTRDAPRRTPDARRRARYRRIRRTLPKLLSGALLLALVVTTVWLAATWEQRRVPEGSAPAAMPSPDSVIGHRPILTHELVDGRLIAVGEAEDGAPGERVVSLLMPSGDQWRLLGQARTWLPGELIRVAEHEKVNTPGAWVITSRLPGGELRHQAVVTAGESIELIDFYLATAPAVEGEYARGPLVLVDKTQNQLWFYQDGKAIKTYPVATGEQRQGTMPTWEDFRENTFTPEGAFLITNREESPRYYGSDDRPPAEPGDPDNPLGTRWLGFSVIEGDYANIWGIHGTPDEGILGQWRSNGTILMANSMIEELFELITGDVPLLIVSGAEQPVPESDIEETDAALPAE